MLAWNLVLLVLNGQAYKTFATPSTTVSAVELCQLYKAAKSGKLTSAKC